MSRPKVYVSGPITNGGKITMSADIDANIIEACKAADVLMQYGFAVYNPMLTVYHERLVGRVSWETWLECDKSWVLASDAVLRLPGDSKGADAEVAWAKEAGIPVYCSVDELLTHFGLETTTELGPCAQAQKYVYGDRENSYGTPFSDLSGTALMWSGVLLNKLKDDELVTPEDVALCMVSVKQSRLRNGYHYDSAVDIAGWAECYWRVVKERERREGSNT